MENYIINNKTVAICKKNNKTVIYDVEKYRVINKNIKKIIELNCNFYGGNLIGRLIYSKKVLNLKYKLPIVLDQSSDLTLIQLNSFRNETTFILVLNKIVDYQVFKDKLKINCVGNNNFIIKMSITNFEKKLINAIKLNNTLKQRKC